MNKTNMANDTKPGKQKVRSSDNPQVIIIAGPNGAGKTTAAPVLLRDQLHVPTYVNADVIAQGLSGFAPEMADRQAARAMLIQFEDLQKRRSNFAFESTLAGRGHAVRVQELLACDYRVHLLYIWLSDPNQAVARVKLRAEHGGHDIPEPIIRRRFERSLRNLGDLYMPIVSSWRVYDGRGSLQNDGVPLIARCREGGKLDIRIDKTWKIFGNQLHALGAEGAWDNG